MPTITKPHAVECPFCLKVLYQTVAVEPGVNAGILENPAFETDRDGHFVVCPHCARRVELEVVPALPVAGLRVRPGQR